MAVKALNHETSTLVEYNRLLAETLSSQFLRRKMSQVFRKHEAQLKQAANSLQETLSRRRELARAMRDFYLAKHRVSYGEGDTFDCEFGTSDAKETMDEIIEQYSSNVFANRYDRSSLSPALSEIEWTLASPPFTTNYVGMLVADFEAEAQRLPIDEKILRPIVCELIGQLIERGHHLRDLSSLSIPMELQDGRTPEERFKSVISVLAAGLSSFVVLASLEDIRFPGDERYKIGNVTLHGQDYDLARLFREFPPTVNEIGESIVRQWSKKVIAEISATAFGTEQAKELANQEIAKAVDILSLEDPSALVREPREDKFSRSIVLDDKMQPVDLSFTNRLELMGKGLHPSARSNIDKILASLNALLTKQPNQLTEFEKRILTGMHFYRRGNAASDFRDKVINYIVSLESILVMEHEHPSSILPKRVLNVLGVSEDFASEVRRLIEDGYHHRGEILHLGVSDRFESERFSRGMQEVDRRLIAVLLNFVGKPGCSTFREFLGILEKETVANRERLLRTAVLDINKEYVGSGVLKHPDGSDIGDVAFTVSYKDDGRYVYILGSVTKFKLRGSLTAETGLYIEGEIEGVAGFVRLDLSGLFTPFGLMELSAGSRTELPFKATDLSKNATSARS
jgi:hypothetical protein